MTYLITFGICLYLLVGLGINAEAEKLKLMERVSFLIVWPFALGVMLADQTNKFRREKGLLQ